VYEDNNLVFHNTISKPMNAGNLYRREFQPLLAKAGLAGEGFTFHSLRHTFATTLAAKGVYPSTAQKMLGHSDIRMTLAIYTHTTDDMQDAATAALESAFS
jgi:integrase